MGTTKFEFTRNIVVESFSFLVAYQVVLEAEVVRAEKDISFFPEPFKSDCRAYFEGKKEQLEKLNDLIKNYRNEF